MAKQKSRPSSRGSKGSKGKSKGKGKKGSTSATVQTPAAAAKALLLAYSKACSADRSLIFPAFVKQVKALQEDEITMPHLVLNSPLLRAEQVTAILQAVKAAGYEALRQIRLWRVPMDGSSMNALAEALACLPRLVTVELMDIPLQQDWLIALQAGVTKSSSLKTLSLDCCTGLDVRSVAMLAAGVAACASVRTLAIRYCRLDAEAMRPLAEDVLLRSGVVTLDLTGNRIGCEGAAILGAALENGQSALEMLELADNMIGTDVAALTRFAACLGPQSTLRSLGLVGNPMHGAAAAPLVAAINSRSPALQVKVALSERTDAPTMKLYEAAASRKASTGKKGKTKGGKGGKGTGAAAA